MWGLGLVSLLGLGALEASFTLRHVGRVLIYRDADYSDIYRFPARPISASGRPVALPTVLDSGLPVLFEGHPNIDSFDSFLEDSETTALLVLRDGAVIGEWYGAGDDATSVQNSFSVSKSVTSALTGIAVRDGLLDKSQAITDIIPELKTRDERFSQITIENLLDMKSGIRYSHDVSFPFFNADDALIYYHPDLRSVLLERTVIAQEPGEFQYNNYNPGLMGLLLSRVTGVPVAEYLEREIWHPLGAIGEAGWTVDDRGFERMESGFFARPRDLARLGLLYLNGGEVDGDRLLSETWVAESTEQLIPEILEVYDGRGWDYRAGWWIIPRPEGPSDFCAIGRFGQFLYVSPHHRIVFVRNGPGRGEWGDRDWTGLFFSMAEQLSTSSETLSLAVKEVTLAIDEEMPRSLEERE